MLARWTFCLVSQSQQCHRGDAVCLLFSLIKTDTDGVDVWIREQTHFPVPTGEPPSSSSRLPPAPPPKSASPLPRFPAPTSPSAASTPAAYGPRTERGGPGPDSLVERSRRPLLAPLAVPGCRGLEGEEDRRSVRACLDWCRLWLVSDPGLLRFRGFRRLLGQSAHQIQSTRFLWLLTLVRIPLLCGSLLI